MEKRNTKQWLEKSSLYNPPQEAKSRDPVFFVDHCQARNFGEGSKNSAMAAKKKKKVVSKRGSPPVAFGHVHDFDVLSTVTSLWLPSLWWNTVHTRLNKFSVPAERRHEEWVSKPMLKSSIDHGSRHGAVWCLIDERKTHGSRPSPAFLNHQGLSPRITTQSKSMAFSLALLRMNHHCQAALILSRQLDHWLASTTTLIKSYYFWWINDLSFWSKHWRHHKPN